MEQDTLTAEHGQQLLKLVRQTVDAYVSNSSLPPPLTIDQPPYSERRGLFVTLRVSGQLRGCMGTFGPDAPLGKLVQQIALTSLNDPRFHYNRITPAELDRLTVELSILSPMTRSRDPLKDMVAGVHGILIRQGNRGGCFLPQVATEMGWTSEEMLDQCCTHKAGLPAKAWRSPDTEVYLFTATIFSEEEQPAA